MGSKLHERDVRIDMHIVIEMGDGKRSDLLFCRNLSEGGMFLECVEQPAKGSVVKLEFSLPHNNSKLRIDGRVVWTSRERKSVHVSGVGIKFESLTDIQKIKLNQAVAYLDNLKNKVMKA